MATWKYKEVKDIINYETPDEIKGKQVSAVFGSCGYVGVGCFFPSNCNWGYAVNVANYKGRLIRFVTVFGEIK